MAITVIIPSFSLVAIVPRRDPPDRLRPPPAVPGPPESAPGLVACFEPGTMVVLGWKLVVFMVNTWWFYGDKLSFYVEKWWFYMVLCLKHGGVTMKHDEHMVLSLKMVVLPWNMMSFMVALIWANWFSTTCHEHLGLDWWDLRFWRAWSRNGT